MGRLHFEALHCSRRKSSCGDVDVPGPGAVVWGTSALDVSTASVCTPVCQVDRPAGPEPGLTSDRVLSVTLSEGQQHAGRNTTQPCPCPVRSGQGCCHGDWVTMVMAGVGEAPAVCCRGAHMGVHMCARAHVLLGRITKRCVSQLLPPIPGSWEVVRKA